MGKIYKFQYLFVHAGIDSKENLSDQLRYRIEQIIECLRMCFR